MVASLLKCKSLKLVTKQEKTKPKRNESLDGTSKIRAAAWRAPKSCLPPLRGVVRPPRLRGSGGGTLGGVEGASRGGVWGPLGHSAVGRAEAEAGGALPTDRLARDPCRAAESGKRGGCPATAPSPPVETAPRLRNRPPAASVSRGGRGRSEEDARVLAPTLLRPEWRTTQVKKERDILVPKPGKRTRPRLETSNQYQLPRVRGSVCVFPQDQQVPVWVPKRLIRITAVPAQASTEQTIEDDTSDTVPEAKKKSSDFTYVPSTTFSCTIALSSIFICYLPESCLPLRLEAFHGYKPPPFCGSMLDQ
ncbi:uncharacterized protein LOC124993734 [Sciurus carolinensis]|uniref:uncharacterized protein LOC124993734 n=1 Tax=Sciurus carolinensis TaxID=30640 RepID=UPI001FB2BA12|nr:uncharacterized protein LOC124993734 [Sciurus carolinensis]